MKPLNRQARTSALLKFIFFLLLSFLLVATAIFSYTRVPEQYFQTPVFSTPGWIPAFKEKLKETIILQNKINFLIVMDATPGMDPYFPVVSEVVEKSKSLINDTSKILNFAAAFYRDAAEGDFLWDFSGRRFTAEAVANWLNRIIAQVRDDKDEPEAVYYGLREALNTEILQKGETNVVILIGDAGNHAQSERTDVAPNEIIQLLSAIPSHFFAIQVRHPDNDDTYNQFIPQIRDEILTPVIQLRKDQLSNYPALANNQINADWEMVTDDSGEHYRIHQGNSWINDLFALKDNSELPTDKFQAQLEQIFKEVVQVLNQDIEALRTLETSDSLSTSDEKAGWIISTLFDNEVPKAQVDYFINKTPEGGK